MKTSVLTKCMLIATFIFFYSLPATYGETPPIAARATLLSNLISAGDAFSVAVTLTIAPDHHVYKDQVTLESADTVRFVITSVEMPPGKITHDRYLEKEVELYEGTVEFKVLIQTARNIPSGIHQAKILIRYQGCSDAFCFAPRVEEFTLPVEISPARWTTAVVHESETPAPPVSTTASKTGSSGFQKSLESKGIFLSLILIFLAGIGMSFTPCVYPMIPITIAVIGGQASGDQSAEKRPLRSLILSLIYVLGIAIVYAAMGVTAASTGALFGTALQSPWVIGFVVAVFLGLAMSMFGVYYLRVPSFISDRLGTKTRQGFAGVFIMGMVSGIVASPCIGPALASLLVYIASTGNRFLGFVMLFVFAWGLGLILIIFGAFSGAIKSLPKSGGWMETVERFFGLLLVGAAIYYMRLIIPESAFIVILGIFLIVTAVFSGGFDRLTPESNTFHRVKKSFGLVVFIFGVYFLVGHLMMKGLILPPFSSTAANQRAAAGEKIDWLSSEEEGLRKARDGGSVVMIDFWAEGSSACLELEKTTWTDTEVIKETKKQVNIKIDCTNTNDPKIKQLWAKYGIVGLPTIIFIDKNGVVMKDKAITGFVNAEGFLRRL